MTALLAGLGVALGFGVLRPLPPMGQQSRAGLFAVIVLGMVCAYLLGLHGRRERGSSSAAAATSTASSAAAVQVNLYGSLDRLAHAEWRSDAVEDRDQLAVTSAHAALEHADDLDPVEARELWDSGDLERERP